MDKLLTGAVSFNDHLMIVECGIRSHGDVAPDLPSYWIVTFSDPLEQVPEEVMDAVTVVVPVATSVANPGVEENVSTEVLPDVHVALFVTLPLLPVAVN